MTEFTPGEGIPSDEELASTKQAVCTQFNELETAVNGVLKARIGEEAYQSEEDFDYLSDQEDDLLNTDSQALTDMLRDNERDAICQKHFGVSFSQLTSMQRLLYVTLHEPITGSERDARAIEERLDIFDALAAHVTERDPTVSKVELLTGVLDFTDALTGERVELVLHVCDHEQYVEMWHLPSMSAESWQVAPREKEPLLFRRASKLLASAIEHATTL